MYLGFHKTSSLNNCVFTLKNQLAQKNKNLNKANTDTLKYKVK